MINRLIPAIAVVTALVCGAPSAQETGDVVILTNGSSVILTPAPLGDELVLLPGQGETKDETRRPARTPKRLVPGGGLLMSFDLNKDGSVSGAEITTGAALAYARADANNDGNLTALEQQDWAETLPTRDETLSNPSRFDPNLDRSVTREEFVSVVEQIAAAYIKDGDGALTVAELAAPEKRADWGDRPFERRQRQRGDRIQQVR